MKRILLATVALAALAGHARAADMAVKAQPPAPVCYWCGFYIGGTLGGAWSDDNSVNVVTTNTFINFPALSALGRTAGPASAVASSANLGARQSGLTGGFEAGYNWQFGPTWVAGFETDIEGIGHSGGSAAITQVAPRAGFPGFNYTSTVAVSEKVNYLGTVRGRLGYLFTPSFLLYGTGGLAYGGVGSTTLISGAETPLTGSTPIAGAGTTSGTRTGWTAGVGLEWMWTRNWTVKAEWLHYDLGSVTYSNGTMTSSLTSGLVNFTDASASSVKFSGDLVRAGLNYKF
jgi:outer membrane immunogenic protein